MSKVSDSLEATPLHYIILRKSRGYKNISLTINFSDNTTRKYNILIDSTGVNQLC